MSFYLELHKATAIKRDEDGRPYAWRAGVLIKKFTEPLVFVDYVHDNAKKLKDAVAVTGSATLLTNTNALITDELRKAGVL